MDWLFGWFDGFVQQVVLNSIWSQFKWVDWFAILFLFLGIIYGIQSGMMTQIAEIAEMMLVVYLVLEHYEKVSDFLKKYSGLLPKEHEVYYKAVGYIVTALIVWITAALFLKLIQKFFHAKASKSLKAVGGAFLGAVHLLIIFSFLSQAILLMPLRRTNQVFEKRQSYTGYYIARLAPSIHDIVAHPLTIFRGDSPS